MLENGTSIKEVVKKMKHNEKKIVDITMKKFIINVEENVIGHVPIVWTNI